MKKVFYILITFLFIVSNVGISIVIHYCSGTPSGIATGREYPFCETECTGNAESEIKNSEPSLLSNDCCVNDYITHKITDEFAKADSPLRNQPITDFLFAEHVCDIHHKADQTFSFTAFESPPFPVRDLRKLHSSLLI